MSEDGKLAGKVLVIGSGGREHAICWKLVQSKSVSNIYALPGSYGIAELNKCENVSGIDIKDFKSIAQWCVSNNIQLVVVGPEDPLAEGLGDSLKENGINCFGPPKMGAKIESDKKWAKEFMQKYNIPTAQFETFTNAELAKTHIKESSYKAWVVKASGLAAGKGVIVGNSITDACNAVDNILGSTKFGAASDTIVVEELLEGEEVSLLAFVDKNSINVMLPAQDHKRLKEGDKGPNTGGMGAYCPCPLVSDQEISFIKANILQKTVDGLRKDGIDYNGVLYAGLMLTKDGPKVLEFNCRFGDPETEVILPLLKSDLYSIMYNCATNRLSETIVEWQENSYAVGVVMASAGYPESSTKGCVINGLPENSDKDIIFHSGVAVNNDNEYLTNGGRVLIAVAVRDNLEEAINEATKICRGVTFSGAGAQFRTDIGAKGLKVQRGNDKVAKSLSYKDSGVDIDAGDDLVQRIKPLARGTSRSGVLDGIGGFGGLFRLRQLNYKKPLLSEATNGVGSKIGLALEYQMYERIGYDLLAMCANDVLESGAEPVAFLDYIACGKLEVPIAAQIIKGMVDGCREAKCALLGGETAEMPSVYAVGKYDLAGYCVGIVEQESVLPKFSDYEEGDMIISLPSSGLHCSGFSSILRSLNALDVNLGIKSEFGNRHRTLAQALCEPTKLYVMEVLNFLKGQAVKAIAHISTGLLPDVQRIIPDDFETCLDFGALKIPDVYGWLAVKLKLTPETLLENLNCGIGMVLVVPKTNTNWRTMLTGAKILGIIKRKGAALQKQIEVRNFVETLEDVSKQFGQFGNNELTDPQNINVQKELTTQAEGRTNTFIAQNGKILTAVPTEYKDPILVMGTDGVGTKIKIAQQIGRNNTVGIDLVAMCVNDILCNGAKPLTFSTYYACGELNTQTTNALAAGVLEGTTQADSALIAIKLSEVPLLYKPGVYDVAGFALGITNFDHMLPREFDIEVGDSLIGLPSSGLHSNGFSLVHAVMKVANVTYEDITPFSDKTFGEEFLYPTKIYVSALYPLIKLGIVKGIAHITGGGLTDNIPRVLNDDVGVYINSDLFTIPPVFGWLSAMGNLATAEMQRTFNCGIGAVIVIHPRYEKAVMDCIQFSERACKIGKVVQRQDLEPQVTIENLEKNLKRVQKVINQPRKRVAVLISGSGTNLQALIDASQDTSQGLHSKIVLVISNNSDVLGIKRAEKFNIPTIVLSHKEFKSREDFDSEMSKHLENAKVDIICLAGFMRILSAQFVKRWKGRLINIHPSLLPKHPGLHVQQKALDAKDKESGCTVHFVDEGVDTGAIIVQKRVPILKDDTEEILTNRIRKAEHYAFPRALRLLATGLVKLGDDGKAVFEF
ncbi:trifunctional purine biosynthetic protein adenosine-3 [Teleopsis dalmanni]|nr:trifunctional purine biosynthetic protein adenosine-3 [Teleopsis dalmanni]